MPTNAAGAEIIRNAELSVGHCPLDDDDLIDFIVQFVEVFNGSAGIVLHHYQLVFIRRIIESIIKKDSAILTGLWSRQSGKSEALASLAGGLCVIMPALWRQFPKDPRLTAYAEGFWIGIFAPKRQQAELIYTRVRSRAERQETQEIYQDPDIGVTVTASRGDLVSWSSGSFVNAMTASEHSNSEGRTYHLMFLDEAQLISKTKVNKELKPMLAATNGTLVQIGTANALLGNFRETILYNIESEKKTGKQDHFEFPYDVVISHRRATYERTRDPKHLNYEMWVNKEIERLGGSTENEEFRQNFKLLWRFVHTGAIDLAAFSESADTERGVQTAYHAGRVVAGLDFGKKRDCTILTVGLVDPEPVIDEHVVVRPDGTSAAERRLFHVVHVLAWYKIPGKRWREILTRAAAILQNYSLETLYCDGTGVGDPLTESMQDLMPDVAVVAYMMSHVGNDRAYKHYLTELEAGRFTYPADEETQQTEEFMEFVHEHEQLIRDRVGVFTKCYAPEGEHDDYPDSTSLMMLAAADTSRHTMREIEVEDNVFFNGGSSNEGRGRSRSDRYR
jgi:hypothetical protein